MKPTNDYIVLLARLCLGGVFLWSAGAHVGDTMAFQVKVNQYNILPPSLEHMFALILPWVMLLGAVLVLFGLLTRAGSASLGLCLVSFLVAVGVNLYRDRVMGCGCFSEEGNQIGWDLMVQDAVLLLFAVYITRKGGGGLSLDRLVFGRSGKPAPNSAAGSDHQRRF